MTSRVRVPGRRRRGLTLVAVAALVGGPLLAGPAAGAEPAGTVTFTGGCGLLGSGLGARSSPDSEQVRLPPGRGLRFANQLGRAATLRLDGEAAADIPAGGSAEVVFHDGPVLATMQINCLLGEPAGAVTVEVAPVVQPRPEQPSTPGGTTPPGSPRSGGSATSGRPVTGPSGGPVDGSGRVDGSWWSGAPAAPGGEASGFAPHDDLPRGPAAPDGGLSPRWGLATEPSHGGGSSAGPANVDPQAADGELAADELSRTSGSAPGDGPIGLLALVATVCVVGVSAGAIRTVISQRAHRAAVGLNRA